MNKYVVTYRTLALSNSEIEVDPKKAEEVRAEIAKKTKYHEPAVTGRDWDWEDCVRSVVIEADYYSVSNEGSAHFYRKRNDNAHEAFKPDLIATVTSPVTIALKDDPGTGGIGWYENKGFPPGTFSANPETESRLRHDIINALRERGPLVYGRDWYFTPVMVPATAASKIPPRAETPDFNKICLAVRYRSTDGRVKQRHFEVDKDYFLDLVALDEVDGA